MYYVFYICANILYGLYELVNSYIYAYSYQDMNDAQGRYYQRMVVCLSRWLFRIRHSVRYIDNIASKNDDIVLLTVSHQNCLDFIVLNEFLTIHYPLHKPVFVFNRKSVRSLFPFVEHWMEQMHVIVGKGCAPSVDDLKEKFIRLGYPRQRIVIVLFPEGRLFTRENHQKSLIYSLSSEIEPFRAVLMPRQKAFEAIRKAAQLVARDHKDTTCSVAGVALSYPECDKRTFAFTKHSDLFIPPVAITRADWTLFDATGEDDILEIWRRMDAILQEKQDQTITEEDEDDDFLWHTSQLMCLGIPFVLAWYGWLLGLLLCLLLFTSYQWHCHHVWQRMDNVIAVITYCAFFSTYQECRARSMLVLGLASHIVFERFSTNKQSRRFGHMALHAFCYMSVFAEIDVCQAARKILPVSF